MVSPSSTSSSSDVLEEQNHLGSPQHVLSNTPDSNISPNSTSSTVRENNFSSESSILDTAERLEWNQQSLADILATQPNLTVSSLSSMSEASIKDLRHIFNRDITLSP